MIKTKKNKVPFYNILLFWLIAAVIVGGVITAVWLTADHKAKVQNKPANAISSLTAATNSIAQTISTNEKNNISTSSTQSSSAVNAVSIVYKNSQYGFLFTLPQSWSGYKIITDKWEGQNSQTGKTVADGPEILIRNPKWTSKVPYQDIPIMIFTIAQWNSVQNYEYVFGAAPILPSELSRNSVYVFALPARYNYAFPNGYEEVETILAGNPISPVADNLIYYENNQYGFLFSLPFDWKGYKIVTETWKGSLNGKTVASDPEILIRNPKWTSKVPYQDIPIMVFTITQWNSMQKGAFYISAAPFGPSELGRNSKYVFAIPPRYNYAFPQGYKEVETILAGNPLLPN